MSKISDSTTTSNRVPKGEAPGEHVTSKEKMYDK